MIIDGKLYCDWGYEEISDESQAWRVQWSMPKARVAYLALDNVICSDCKFLMHQAIADIEVKQRKAQQQRQDDTPVA